MFMFFPKNGCVLDRQFTIEIIFFYINVMLFPKGFCHAQHFYFPENILFQKLPFRGILFFRCFLNLFLYYSGTRVAWKYNFQKVKKWKCTVQRVNFLWKNEKITKMCVFFYFWKHRKSSSSPLTWGIYQIQIHEFPDFLKKV